MPRLNTLRSLHGDSIEDAYVNGDISIKVIAADHGVSPNTIRAILNERGVAIKRPGRPQKKEK